MQEVTGATDAPLHFLQQGGCFAVLIVVLYFYRRDFLRRDEQKDEWFKTVVRLVETTTVALTENTGAARRNARAVEQMNQRRRFTDPPMPPLPELRDSDL